MKQKLTILLFALFAVTFASAHKFVLATYNIRLQNDGDANNGDGWQQRCPYLTKLIRFHGFEIFGTQEGFRNQLEDMKAQLPGYEYIGVGRDDGKKKGEHSAIFYDTNKFELIESGNFWLSPTAQAWAGMPHASEYAHGAFSRLREPSSNSSITICTWIT